MTARDSLLDAAFRLLAEETAELRPDAVAREAGVSKALVFHHFGTREGMLDAMAARVLSQTQEGLTRLAEDYPNPRERLLALARTLLEDPREPPASVRRVLQFWTAEDAQGGCRASLRDALVADFVAATLRDGVATGAVRTGVDAGALARRLLARWHGATLVYATTGQFDFEAEAERVATELMETITP